MLFGELDARGICCVVAKFRLVIGSTAVGSLHLERPALVKYFIAEEAPAMHIMMLKLVYNVESWWEM